jgi:multiple sugar transport system substrate-binding protein
MKKKMIVFTLSLLLAVIFLSALTFEVALAAREIRFAMFGAAFEVELYKKWMSKFEEETGIKVKLETYPHDDHEDKMVMAFLGGATPDVVKLATEGLPGFAEMGMFIPLDDYIKGPRSINKGDFWDFIWEAPGIVWKDKIRAIPIDAMCFSLFYNKDLFKEAGLDPEKPPKTWEEFRSYAIQLTKDIDKDGKIDQWGFGPPGWDLPFFTLVYQNDGEIWSKDPIRPRFNEAPGVEALQFLVDLIFKDKCTRSPAISPGEMSNDHIFGMGKIAMVISGPWWMAWMKTTYPDINYGIAELPVGKQKANCAFSSTFGISVHSKDPDAAWEWLRYIMAYEQQLDWGLARISIPSRRAAAEEAFIECPDFLVFIEGLKYARADHPIPGFDAVRQIFGPEFTAALDPAIRKDPKQALDDAAKRIIEEVLE